MDAGGQQNSMLLEIQAYNTKVWHRMRNSYFPYVKRTTQRSFNFNCFLSCVRLYFNCLCITQWMLVSCLFPSYLWWLSYVLTRRGGYFRGVCQLFAWWAAISTYEIYTYMSKILNRIHYYDYDIICKARIKLSVRATADLHNDKWRWLIFRRQLNSFRLSLLAYCIDIHWNF